MNLTKLMKSKERKLHSKSRKKSFHEKNQIQESLKLKTDANISLSSTDITDDITFEEDLTNKSILNNEIIITEDKKFDSKDFKQKIKNKIEELFTITNKKSYIKQIEEKSYTKLEVPIFEWESHKYNRTLFKSPYECLNGNNYLNNFLIEEAIRALIHKNKCDEFTCSLDQNSLTSILKGDGSLAYK